MLDGVNKVKILVKNMLSHDLSGLTEEIDQVLGDVTRQLTFHGEAVSRDFLSSAHTERN